MRKSVKKWERDKHWGKIRTQLQINLRNDKGTLEKPSAVIKEHRDSLKKKHRDSLRTSGDFMKQIANLKKKTESPYGSIQVPAP